MVSSMWTGLKDVVFSLYNLYTSLTLKRLDNVLSVRVCILACMCFFASGPAAAFPLAGLGVGGAAVRFAA